MSTMFSNSLVCFDDYSFVVVGLHVVVDDRDDKDEEVK